jgi:hypothetical protein
MSTRNVADVVFCIDASASMSPCIDAVKAHVSDFVAGLMSDGQTRWDLRLDFLAHSAGARSFTARTAATTDAIQAIYHGGDQSLFVGDLERFRSALAEVGASGDEAGPVALDCCLDLPWRPAASCHRVVIMLTDEPFESGDAEEFQRPHLDRLVEKVQQLHVMLYLVAPRSPAYDLLSSAQRSEYTEVGSSGDGLTSVDFGEVLQYVGKSVSQSVLQGGAGPTPARGLFGQATWQEGGGGRYSMRLP